MYGSRFYKAVFRILLFTTIFNRNLRLVVKLELMTCLFNVTTKTQTNRVDKVGTVRYPRSSGGPFFSLASRIAARLSFWIPVIVLGKIVSDHEVQVEVEVLSSTMFALSDYIRYPYVISTLCYLPEVHSWEYCKATLFAHPKDVTFFQNLSPRGRRR